MENYTLEQAMEVVRPEFAIAKANGLPLDSHDLLISLINTHGEEKGAFGISRVIQSPVTVREMHGLLEDYGDEPKVIDALCSLVSHGMDLRNTLQSVELMRKICFRMKVMPPAETTCIIILWILTLIKHGDLDDIPGNDN